MTNIIWYIDIDRGSGVRGVQSGVSQSDVLESINPLLVNYIEDYTTLLLF